MSTVPSVNKLIEIRPIEMKKWHEKKGEESFTRAKKIQALVDPRTMKYATGLNQEDIINLKEKARVDYDLSDHFTMDGPHPFWDSPMGVVKLENHTMFFDIGVNPLKFIHYKIMKASKYVANSMAEYEQGLWAEATHVIWDESEQVEIKAQKTQTKNNAIIAVSQVSPERKKEVILIMRGKNVKGMSDSFIIEALDEIVLNDAALLLEVLNLDKKELSTKALVLEAIQRGVFRKDGHRIYHMDTAIGNEEEDVVKYLLDDANQDFKMIIMSKLKD